MPHNNDSNGNSRKLPQSNACRNRTLRCKALYEYKVATNICVYMHPNKCIAVRNTQTLPLHCIFYHQHHLQQQQRHFAATTQSCIIPPSTAKHRASECCLATASEVKVYVHKLFFLFFFFSRYIFHFNCTLLATSGDTRANYPTVFVEWVFTLVQVNNKIISKEELLSAFVVKFYRLCCVVCRCCTLCCPLGWVEKIFVACSSV